MYTGVLFSGSIWCTMKSFVTCLFHLHVYCTCVLHCLLNFLFCKSTEPKGEENTDVAREEEKKVTITTPQKASVILRTNRDSEYLNY